MLEISKKIAPKLVTFTLVVVAAIAAYALYWRYIDTPWTRDGQVRAEIVKIAPRVQGYIVKVTVKSNQFVRKGDLLFEIDPSSYQLAVDKAQVALDQAREEVTALEAAVRAAQATVQQQRAAATSAQGNVEAAQAGIRSAEAAVKPAESGVVSAHASIAQTTAQLEEAKREAERAKRLADERVGSVETAESKAAAVEALQAQLVGANAGVDQAQAAVAKAKAGEGEARAKLVIAQYGLAEAQAAVITSSADEDKTRASLGESGEANVRIRAAQVELDEARLNLAWTKIYAPSDGYVTNMEVHEGMFAAAGTPFVAFVDSDSFRVDGYFQETKLKHFQPGDTVTITLMSHPELPFEGEVESIGWAVDPPNIADTEGTSYLVPQIEPTFDWVRLAQRVPVRIRLKEVPENIQLISGATASISIKPGNN